MTVINQSGTKSKVTLTKTVAGNMISSKIRQNDLFPLEENWPTIPSKRKRQTQTNTSVSRTKRQNQETNRPNTNSASTKKPKPAIPSSSAELVRSIVRDDYFDYLKKSLKMKDKQLYHERNTISTLKRQMSTLKRENEDLKEERQKYQNRISDLTREKENNQMQLTTFRQITQENETACHTLKRRFAYLYLNANDVVRQRVMHG